MTMNPKAIPYKWQALLTVSIGTFMATLDSSIVNISFPRLVQVFDTKPSIVLWVSVAYLLVSVGLMLTIGKMGDYLGRKRIYVAGFTLFTIGLGLCALSQSILQLILFRVIQAFGAAMTVSLSNAIITSAFPSEERGKALGIIGGMVSAGLLSGPVLGGFLLDTFDWQAIFYLRVPVGVLGIAMAMLLLREQTELDKNLKFDLTGAVTLFGSLSCLLMFFNFGGRMGFLSWQALILLCTGIILLGLFIYTERRALQPIIDLNLFRHRLFAAGNVSMGIMFVAISANTFLMPFYLINALSFSASKAGLLFAAVSVTTLLVGPVSGWLSDRIGYRILCTVGMALICISLFLFSRFSINSSEVDIIIRFVILGIGIGMFSSPNNSSIMGSVPRDKLGTGSAMIATTRQIGISSGIAIAGAIFTSRQAYHASQMAQQDISTQLLDKITLVAGFQDALIVSAIFCTIAVVTSFARGSSRPIA